MTATLAILALADVARAGFGGEVLIVGIALALAAFKWLADKAREANTQPPPMPGTTVHERSIREEPQARGESEEERMRKFMEALGLPPESARPISRREAPMTLRPAPDRQAHERPTQMRPVPPIVARPVFPGPISTRPPRLPAAHIGMPKPPRPRSLDEADAPTLPVSQIHLAPLQTPDVPEFETLSSVVTAIPFESAAEDADAPPAALSPAAEARALLRSPGSMRSAVVLREILGPPRGLQSGFGTPTFPSL